MTSQRATLAALVVALGVGLAGVGSATASDAPAKHAADWIVSRQQSDGAFGSATERASDTGETLAAVVAGGASGAPVDKALAYIKAHGKAAATEGAYTGRIIAGLVAGGQNPSEYVKILHSQYNAATGQYDPKNFFSDLLGANGANAAKDTIPGLAIAYIERGQCADGGFAFSADCSKGSDVDTTAWAINVLIASGHKADQGVSRAKSFLLSVQRPDGGFKFSSNTPVDETSSDSTGLAIAAINALGEDAQKAPWLQKDGDDPVKALLALQTSSGSFRQNKSVASGNLESTVNAIPGLARKSYPVRGAATQPQPSTTPQPSHSARGGGTATNTTPGPYGLTSAEATVSTPVPMYRPATAQKGPSSPALSPANKAVKPKPTPYVLGFGGITTKPGGLSMAVWGAIAAGCTGLGLGIWFLRARLR